MTFKEFENIILEKFPEVTGQQMEQFRKMEELYRDWNSKINVVSRKDIDRFLCCFRLQGNDSFLAVAADG